MNIKTSDFIFRWVPTVLLICYGVSMALTIVQYKIVGLWPSAFRVLAWNFVLYLVLRKDLHIEAMAKRLHVEQEITRALDTIGIRREEYQILKAEVESYGADLADLYDRVRQVLDTKVP